jgi:hypothetical protein
LRKLPPHHYYLGYSGPFLWPVRVFAVPMPLFAAPEVSSKVSHCQLTGRPLDSGDRSDRGSTGLGHRPCDPFPKAAGRTCPGATTRRRGRACPARGEGTNQAVTALVGQTIDFRRLSTPGRFIGLTGSKKAGGTACPTNSGQAGQAVSPANPDFSWHSAGRRPSATDHKRRWSVPPRTAVACLSRADTRLQLNMNPEAAKLVSGHGFSRAANREHSLGFSPCLSRRVRRTGAPGLPSQGLKPSRWIRSARLKPCPDTKPVSQGISAVTVWLVASPRAGHARPLRRGVGAGHVRPAALRKKSHGQRPGLWECSFAEAERHEPSRPRAGSLSRRRSVEAG